MNPSSPLPLVTEKRVALTQVARLPRQFGLREILLVCCGAVLWAVIQTVARAAYRIFFGAAE